MGSKYPFGTHALLKDHLAQNQHRTGHWFCIVLSQHSLFRLPIKTGTLFYMMNMSSEYIAFLMTGGWMSRLFKNNLMDDVLNTENESCMQETKLIENEYSINLSTKFWYNKKTA